MGVKYKKEPFELFTIAAYADFLCELIPLIRPDIVVQRLFGLSDLDLLIAPNWGLKKSEIQHYFDKTIQDRNIVQGSKYLK
jgi:radical SAM superfamily enzyme